MGEWGREEWGPRKERKRTGSKMQIYPHPNTVNPSKVKTFKAVFLHRSHIAYANTVLPILPSHPCSHHSPSTKSSYRTPPALTNNYLPND